MPLAAAAVVGTGRGSGRFNLGRRPDPLHESKISGATLAAGLATCVCVALNAVGISMLVSSTKDERGELVADYDRQVEKWEFGARGGFAELDLDVVARWGSGRTAALRLLQSHEGERLFRDAEHGKGLMPYRTLTYTADLEFGSYYPGAQAQAAKHWAPLPERSAAMHVTLEFSVRARNGSASRFVTPAMPLVWDEVVHARTPAPDDKCSRERHGSGRLSTECRARHPACPLPGSMSASGIWRDRNCHVVKRLDYVCLQVDLDSNGTWSPLRKEVPVEQAASSHSTVRPETQETYGCDPQNAWNPAVYILDPCWGRPVTQRCPQPPREKHTVTVTVRSAIDPYIRAEELTNDTFDFGLSPTSLRANGLAMLSVGLCISLLPCARLYQWRRRKRAEDRRSLKDERDDCEDRGCPPGIYGNSAM